MGEKTSAAAVKAEGLRLFNEGLYEEALERFGRAQELFAAEGNDAEAAEMLNNMGVVYRLTQEWSQAQAALEEAREAFNRAGDRHREAQALGNLGGLLASQGEHLKAQEYLRQAADIFAEVGDGQLQGETLMALGAQMWREGDRRGGIAAYQAGLFALERPKFQQKALRRLLQLTDRLLVGRSLVD
jgi:tetratricopeptide (TPR) repeat protein